MGLGKTIQAIAAAEILARTAGRRARCWWSAPTSLKHQWQREIEKFTDRSADGRRGPAAAAAGLYAEDSFYKITNYDVIHRDLELIRRWEPDLVILDEAQRIKNWKTRTAAGVKRLDVAIRLRAHRHAAGEPARGTALDRRVRRPLPPGADVPLPGRPPARGRDAAGWSAIATSRRSRQTLAPDPASAAPRTRCSSELPERLDKRFFVPMTPSSRSAPRGEPRNRGADRAEVAPLRLPVRGRPAAPDDRPPKHADVMQQHVPAGPARPTTASRPTSCRRCWTKCSRRPRPRW